MAYHSFEDLEVWQRACRVAESVYALLKDSREYSFKDQMTRSSLSIPSNIAEGSERNSGNEFILFLGYAKGSCAELRTQLFIAGNIGIIARELIEPLLDELTQISAMLHALIKKLKSSQPQKSSLKS